MSQRKVIRNALLKGKKVSPLSALRDYGCMRLASRISEIRKGRPGEPPLALAEVWREQGGKRYKVFSLPEQHDETCICELCR